MRVCLICGFQTETGSGLASHRRAKHKGFQGPNRIAAEEMLTILKELGRIEDVDAARVQTIRSLANSLDTDDTNAQMWRTYREAVEDLMRLDDDADAGLAAALAEIRSAGPMGYASEA